MKERKKRERKKENNEQVVKDCDNGIMCLPRMPKTMAKVWSFIEIIAMILFFVFLLRF
jgi:hypothetical protein